MPYSNVGADAMGVVIEGEGPLAVMGAGGFAMQMLDMLDRIRESGRGVLLVDESRKGDLMGYPIVPMTAVAAEAHWVIAIASTDIRRAVVERLLTYSFARLISPPHAIVSPRATVGKGTVICDQAVVEAGAVVGDHVHVNVGTHIAHECNIGDFVTFAPRVNCNGNVKIERGATIGTGVKIRQGAHGKPLTIGEGAVLQMGAVITRDVPPFAIVRALTVH